MLTRFSRNIGRFVLPAVALLTLGGVTVGCGGGGGGGTSQQATLASTRAATIRVVQQSRGLPTLLGIVGGSLIDPSTLSRSSNGRVTFAKASLRLWQGTAGKATRQTSDLMYIPELDLYARTTESTLSYRVDFYEDAAGNESAGNIIASVTGLTTGRVVFELSGGNLPINGTLNLTRVGEDTIRTTGTVRLPLQNESVSPDLTTQADGTTTGSLSVANAQGTIRYRNLQADPAGSFDADLEYRGTTGDVTQDSSGSGQVRLGLSNTRRYEAAYNTDGSGTLTVYNNSLEGQVEVVGNFDDL